MHRVKKDKKDSRDAKNLEHTTRSRTSKISRQLIPSKHKIITLNNFEFKVNPIPFSLSRYAIASCTTIPNWQLDPSTLLPPTNQWIQLCLGQGYAKQKVGHTIQVTFGDTWNISPQIYWTKEMVMDSTFDTDVCSAQLQLKHEAESSSRSNGSKFVFFQNCVFLIFPRGTIELSIDGDGQAKPIWYCRGVSSPTPPCM
jgi:hypothetical protein